MSEGKESLNCVSHSTVKMCEMVPFKPGNSGRQEPSLPACWGCPTPGSDLTKVGPWLRHPLPAFQVPPKMPALGVGLLLSWSTFFFQDRESVHAAVGGGFFLQIKESIDCCQKEIIQSKSAAAAGAAASIPWLLSDQSPPQVWGAASSCEDVPASTGS